MISKKIFAFLTVSAILAVVGCSINFNEHYDKVDSNKVRPISYWITTDTAFSLSPFSSSSPETAPGDTAALLVFIPAGDRKITFDEIKWRVCWNIYTDEYGNLAPRGGAVELEVIQGGVTDYIMGGQIAIVQFKIPDDILHKSDAIPNDLSGFSKIYSIGDMENMPKTKAEALGYLERLANDRFLQYNIPYDIGIKIDGLAQIFSCMYEIYMDIPGVPRTKIRHAARYHKKLRYISNLYGYRSPVCTNGNPYLTSLDFYQGGWYVGDGLIGDTIEISLDKDIRSTITLGILYAGEVADRFYSLERAFSLNPSPMDRVNETYGLRIFYSDSIYGKIELKNGAFINLGAFGADNTYTEEIIIHRDKLKEGDTGWIWIMVYDECYGVANFPQGRDMEGFPVKFVK